MVGYINHSIFCLHAAAIPPLGDKTAVKPSYIQLNLHSSSKEFVEFLSLKFICES